MTQLLRILRTLTLSLLILMLMVSGLAIAAAMVASKGGPASLVGAAALVAGELALFVYILRTHLRAAPPRKPVDENEDVFEGRRGIVWAVVLLVIAGLLIVVASLIMHPIDAIQGFIDGWNR